MSEEPSGGTGFQILRGYRDGCDGRETRVREMANWLFDEGKVGLTAFITFFWSVLMFCMSMPIMEDAVQVEGFPESAEFAVMDTSGVLSLESHDYFNQATLKLKQDTGAEIFVAAVPGISGDAKGAVTQLFNGLESDGKDRKNRVLLFFTTDYRHVRLHRGSDLKSCLYTHKAEGILHKYAVPDIRKGLWNTAARNTWNALAREIYSCHHVQPPAAVMEENGSFDENAVKTYTHPRVIKTRSEFGSGTAILGTFSGMAMGAGLMLVLYLALYDGAGSDEDQGWSGRVKGGRSRGRRCFS